MRSKDREQHELEVLITDLKYNGGTITPGMCDCLGMLLYLEEGKTPAPLQPDIAVFSCCVPGQIVKQRETFSVSDRSRCSGVRPDRLKEMVYIFW